MVTKLHLGRQFTEAMMLQIPGLVNVDFADVRTIMSGAGSSLMGQGTGSGKGRAKDAAVAAISSPLLDIGFARATGLVWNITGPPDLTLFEVCYPSYLLSLSWHYLADVRKRSFLTSPDGHYVIFALQIKRLMTEHANALLVHCVFWQTSILLMLNKGSLSPSQLKMLAYSAWHCRSTKLQKWSTI